jgi:hypothetical protein
MWVRGIVGVVLILVGAVWVAQGTGAMSGSGMSGHGQYALLGAVVIVIGLALILWRIISGRVASGKPREP